MKIHNGMITTPALPRLRKLANEVSGHVHAMADFSNTWPNRWTNPGDVHHDLILIAQGWDGNKLYGVTATR